MTDEEVEVVARAIEAAEWPDFSIRLTRLVDGVSTYTLVMGDAEEEFRSHQDASDAMNARRKTGQARAAIVALDAFRKEKVNESRATD